MKNEIFIHELTLPFGRMRLGSLGDALCLSSWLEGPKPDRPLSRLAAECQADVKRGTTPVIVQAADELTAWCEGDRRVFDVPILMHGTEFQQCVWQGLRELNYGEMATYAALSKRIGRARAVRAVAGACGANPLHVLIPCHRVVGHGDLGGFAGGRELKMALLRHEFEVTNTPILPAL